jgi:hypothetical protein
MKVSSPAQQAHAADRFAREILAILERDTTRSRRLMRHSFGRFLPYSKSTLLRGLTHWEALQPALQWQFWPDDFHGLAKA